MEAELLWPRVWQMACRLEEIAKPGDFVEYEILDQSVIVVRVDEARSRPITMLVVIAACSWSRIVGATGAVSSARSTGGLGSRRRQHVHVLSLIFSTKHNCDATDLRLTEVRVETWGGCAFINFDDACAAAARLHRAVRLVPRCVAGGVPAHRVVAPRALPMNWKLAMEAFMEGYHVMETHPQLHPPGARRPRRRRCTATSPEAVRRTRLPHVDRASRRRRCDSRDLHRDEPALHAHAQRGHGGHDPREGHARSPKVCATSSFPPIRRWRRASGAARSTTP